MISPSPARSFPRACLRVFNATAELSHNDLVDVTFAIGFAWCGSRERVLIPSSTYLLFPPRLRKLSALVSGRTSRMLKVMRGLIDPKPGHVRACNVFLSGRSNSRAAEANSGGSTYCNHRWKLLLLPLLLLISAWYTNLSQSCSRLGIPGMPISQIRFQAQS